MVDPGCSSHRSRHPRRNTDPASDHGSGAIVRWDHPLLLFIPHRFCGGSILSFPLHLKDIHIPGAVAVKMASIPHRKAFESAAASITSYNRKRRERGREEEKNEMERERCHRLVCSPKVRQSRFKFQSALYLGQLLFSFFVCFSLAHACGVISPFRPPLPCQKSHAGNHSPIKKWHQKASFFS